MARISAPVYGFYGENDERIGATVPTAPTEMKAATKTCGPVTYPGEEASATLANKKARGEPWKRWKSLLARGH